MNPEDELTLDDMLEDEQDLQEQDEQAPEAPAQSVAQVSLEEARRVMEENGYVPVPAGQVSPQQAQTSEESFNYADMIQVPDEIADQGMAAEINYRMVMAAQMVAAQQIGPLLDQQAAAQIAGQHNTPEAAAALNAELSQVLGPNWSSAMADPKAKMGIDLMIDGILAKNQSTIKQDRAKVPAPAPIGRVAADTAQNPTTKFGQFLQQSKYAQELGITEADLLRD